MKFSIFAFLGMIRSDPNHNLLLPYMLAGGNDGVNSNTALAMMLAQNAHHGGSGKNFEIQRVFSKRKRLINWSNV